MAASRTSLACVGIFDHNSEGVGGAYLVVSHMAAVLFRRYDVEIIHCGYRRPFATEVGHAT